MLARFKVADINILKQNVAEAHFPTIGEIVNYQALSQTPPCGGDEVPPDPYAQGTYEQLSVWPQTQKTGNLWIRLGKT